MSAKPASRLRELQAQHVGIDLFFLLLTLVHISLVAFDLSYFGLRPYYRQWLPAISQAYDPIKGVEPHRSTESYLQAAQNFFQQCAQNPGIQADMQKRSVELIEEDPFARVGLSGKLEILKGNVREFTGIRHSSKAAFASFWSCDQLAEKQAFFEKELSPYLALNYWRQIGNNGHFIDYFFWIDLAFVLLFLIEFLSSWAKAVRLGGKEQQVLYPLYHWYDLASSLPFPQLRILRLLRLLTLYIRLVRRGYFSLEHLWIYQQVLKYQKIIVEEISDQVSINILTNIQAKTRLGGNRDILEQTLYAYRKEIREVIVNNLGRVEIPTLATRQMELVDTLASLVMQSIRATDDYRQITALPLVRPLVERLINETRLAQIAEQSMEGFLTAWGEKLKSPEMQEILRDLVDDLLDQVIRLSLDERMQELIEDLTIKVLEELKESSTRSKLWRAEEEGLMKQKWREKNPEGYSESV